MAVMPPSRSAATSPKHPSLGLRMTPTPPPAQSFSPPPRVNEMAFELPFRVKFPRASEGGGTIATKDFVEASMEAIKLFDAKAFSPIKIDIQGNIESLQTKLNSDP